MRLPQSRVSFTTRSRSSVSKCRSFSNRRPATQTSTSTKRLKLRTRERSINRTSDVCVARDEHEVRAEIVDGLLLDVVQVDRNEVRRFADFQRADLAIQTERDRTVQRRHPQRRVRRKRLKKFPCS